MIPNYSHRLKILILLSLVFKVAEGIEKKLFLRYKEISYLTSDKPCITLITPRYMFIEDRVGEF